ncbi:tetratricopeptide repeat protein [Candidatus Omnitrophota bacterium]
MNRNQNIFACVILIIILGFAVYGNSLNGKFVWDDDPLIRDNVYIKNWSHLNKIFTRDIMGGEGEESNFYRPLQVFTYMIDYSLWGFNARGYHQSNILFHILATLALFWFVTILFDSLPLALFTSLFFLIHPVHTEAVAYISGRSDPLALLFMLLCLIFYIKGLRERRAGFYLVALLSYVLALLSRENSLVLPALLLLYHYSFKERLRVREFLPILSIAIIYVLLRFTILESLLSNISITTTFFQRVPGFFVAITNYVRLILFPFNLHMEYGTGLFELSNPKAIAGIFILFSLFFYAVKKRNTNRLAFFSISWFFIALLPQSNLYPINAYMAEHWLYLPSIGLFLLLAKGLVYACQNKPSRIPGIIVAVSLLVFYSSLTIMQNIYWREPLVFYEKTLQYATDKAKFYNNLGNIYYALDRREEAITAYSRAIELNPGYAKAYNNLGNIYYALDRREEAITAYSRAIELNPGYAKAYNNLGVLYNSIGRKQDAIISYKQAIESGLGYAEVYSNLGSVYYDINKHEEAMDLFKKAIEINPDFAGAYYNLANAYINLDKKQEAIELYQKAIELNPSYAKAYNSLSLIYFLQKQYKLAIEYCDKAKELGFTNTALSESLKPYRE